MTTLIETINEALAFGFFQRALIIGSLLAIICSLLGNFVILRRESLIAHTISNFAFFGIALGFVFSLNLNFATIATVTLGILFITHLQKSKSISRDSILAFTSQFAMAGAIIAIGSLQGYQPDLMQFLFGNIIAISREDITFAIIISVIVIVSYILFRKKFLQITLSQELARSLQTNVYAINMLYLLLLGLTIAIGIKIIGVILIAAFLVIPSNTSKIIANDFASFTRYSIIFGIFGTITGLFLAYILNIPSGATIILSMGIVFLFFYYFFKNEN